MRAGKTYSEPLCLQLSLIQAIKSAISFRG